MHVTTGISEDGLSGLPASLPQRTLGWRSGIWTNWTDLVEADCLWPGAVEWPLAILLNQRDVVPIGVRALLRFTPMMDVCGLARRRSGSRQIGAR